MSTHNCFASNLEAQWYVHEVTKIWACCC